MEEKRDVAQAATPEAPEAHHTPNLGHRHDLSKCYIQGHTFSLGTGEPDYKQRFRNEYAELKGRYDRLRRMIVRYEASTLDFRPDCPIELLERQAYAMDLYLHCLEVRAQIEHIDI